MKQKITCLLVIATGFFFRAEAKIWRVNNNANATNGSNYGGTAAYPVFQQLFGNSANNAAGSNLVQAGDTVHLEGSTIDYDGGSLSKKLVIIGPGYFLNENPNTSNNVLPAILNAISFNAGSSGSQLIGVHIGDNTGGVNITVSDILIKRCQIDYAVSVLFAISDIKIIQNFFARASTANMISTNTGGFPTDFIFDNNIVLGTLVLPVGYTMLECKNNVFAGPAITGSPSLRLYAGSFQNNILTNPAATVDINGGTNLNVTYNTAASATPFGTASNNVVVADMTTLFVTTGSSDGKYQLKAGSAPGADGSDRGAFGGAAVTSRYTLSGLAPIPVIYDISTSGVATAAGLPVTIKARTIK